MKNRQTRIIMGIMVGLILFSSSIALLMYTKQNSLKGYVEEHTEVYVAASSLEKGDLIKESDLEKAFLPKSYLAFAPLTKSEIVGRYAQVDIYPKEPLRREKIADTKPKLENSVTYKAPKKVVVKKQKELKPANSDTITVSLSLFKNIDSSLKRGDHIDILSVIPKNTKSRNAEYTTKYVALNVKINSFIGNYKNVKRYVYSAQEGSSKADSIVFEMAPDEIKNFLSVYYTTQELNSKRVFNDKVNSGHLWMVKRNSQNSDTLDSVKKKMLVDHKARVYKKRKAAKKVSISYED